ncbi:signal recognition particle 19 kda protein [Anaeramoeba flamelloides]|uniref:Signal recognition particle 19 kDa protein n=1 Tax=Anaeramoeba flamelloides TaxID=1746091 RepID=A0ABQ8XWF3_9EUKA|nr:signal recognition particle 19 kda protein [Anaeramoeba flamelloides]
MSSSNEVEIKKEPRKPTVIIYPSYIDRNTSIKFGRKIGKSKAISNPKPQEIAGVINMLGLPFELQATKGYSRDTQRRGRIKVRLYNQKTNLPLKEEIPNKRQLLFKICEKFHEYRQQMHKIMEKRSKSQPNKKGKNQKGKGKGGGGGSGKGRGRGRGRNKGKGKKKGKKRRK